MPTFEVPAVALYWRTCDSCASYGECIIDGDAYVCVECLEHHFKAVEAATARARRILGPLVMTPGEWHEAVELIVQAYLEFTDERAGKGGD